MYTYSSTLLDADRTLLLALKKQSATMSTAPGKGHVDGNRGQPLGAEDCDPTTAMN